MNDKRKIEINIVEIQPYKILIQINSNESNLALYAELRKSFGKFDVKAGLRFENLKYQSEIASRDSIIGDNISNFFPTAHVLYQLTPNISIVGSYSRKITMPGYFRFDPNNNNYILDNYYRSSGNQYLKPYFFNNYTFKITALDYIEVGAKYSDYKNTSLPIYITTDQSLILTRTYTNPLDGHNWNVYTSFPIPFDIFTKGLKIFKEPINLDKTSYLMCYAEYNKEVIPNYPYLYSFEPDWVFDLNLHLLLPKKLTFNADYSYMPSGYFGSMKIEKPYQSLFVSLSRNFLQNKLNATVEAIIPSVLNASTNTSNLKSNFNFTYDSMFFWFKLTYKFGKFINREETEVYTEKKQVQNEKY